MKSYIAVATHTGSSHFTHSFGSLTVNLTDICIYKEVSKRILKVEIIVKKKFIQSYIFFVKF